MTDVNAVLTANRSAVAELITAAEKTGSAWSVPIAPGKWSPAQLVEHVSRSMEESANEVIGAPSKFFTLPTFVRPLVRGLFFKRVLKKRTFPRARTGKAFDPASGPATPAEGRQRVEGALARFDQACRAQAAKGPGMSSTLFGSVSIDDYATFQEIHTRHHRKQLPA
jgi:hypothetical protein